MMLMSRCERTFNIEFQKTHLPFTHWNNNISSTLAERGVLVVNDMGKVCQLWLNKWLRSRNMSELLSAKVSKSNNIKTSMILHLIITIFDYRVKKNVIDTKPKETIEVEIIIAHLMEVSTMLL